MPREWPSVQRTLTKNTAPLGSHEATYGHGVRRSPHSEGAGTRTQDLRIKSPLAQGVREWDGATRSPDSMTLGGSHPTANHLISEVEYIDIITTER